MAVAQKEKQSAGALLPDNATCQIVLGQDTELCTAYNALLLFVLIYEMYSLFAQHPNNFGIVVIVHSDFDEPTLF